MVVRYANSLQPYGSQIVGQNAASAILAAFAALAQPSAVLFAIHPVT